MSRQTPVVLLRWILVFFAVLAWLIVVPIYELVGLGWRALARSPVGRAAIRLVPIAARPKESPATRE